MRWMSKLVLFPILGVFVAAGCAESKHSGGGSSGKTGNAAVDELVSAYCGTVRSCCGSAGYPTARLGDCEEVFSTIEEFRQVIDGRLTFREPEYTECLAFIRDLARTCDAPEESPCRHLYQGTLPEGATCENGNECRDSGYFVACVRPDNDDVVLPGTCHTLARAQVGAPCIAETDHDLDSTSVYTNEPVVPGVCDRRDGLYCDFDTYSCQPIESAGAACNYDDECADGLYCVATCVPRK